MCYSCRIKFLIADSQRVTSICYNKNKIILKFKHVCEYSVKSEHQKYHFPSLDGEFNRIELELHSRKSYNMRKSGKMRIKCLYLRVKFQYNKITCALFSPSLLSIKIRPKYSKELYLFDFIEEILITNGMKYLFPKINTNSKNKGANKDE